MGLLGFAFLPIAAPAQQQGVAAMQQMIAAYQHLGSYRGAATVSESIQAGSKITRSQSVAVHLSYKRPNRLALVFIQPGSVGMRSVYSDGKTLTIYDALHHQSVSLPTGTNLNAILQILRKRTRIDAELDPLYFLSDGSLPPALTQLSVRGDAVVGGRPSQVVTGLIAAPQMGVPKGKVNLAMHWTWYIDRKTHLLNKIEAYSDPIPVAAPANKAPKSPLQTKPVQTKQEKLVFLFRHLISQVQPDAILPDSQFIFKPPRGAAPKKATAPPQRKAGPVH